ncbi:MAG: cyclopropane-fatty-acyl-phospholipid synthase family protein [Actinomycetota bacterium]
MSGPMGALDNALIELLGRRVRSGRLTVVMPGGARREYGTASPGPDARIVLHDTKLLRRVATLGAIGLADGYIEGEFDSPDLAAVIELCAMQLEPSSGVRVPGILDRAGRAIWRRLGNAAAPRGPLRDVVQHYDLGNDFYERWLDPTMTYSSAVFADDDMTLEQAQREKYRRLAEATGIQRGDRVLEIGCGWGGFATYAASQLGCLVTAITVSKEQLDHVGKLVAERGLAGMIETRLQDFRDTEGSFDRIVSIEMIESIPRTMWETYFRSLRDLTRPGGTIGLQVITVADHHWRTSDANPDFIRRYVFPGGQVPAPKVLRELARAHGLAWTQDHGYGGSYARTLRTWRENFDTRSAEVAGLGFDERFRRMWRYYLAYCEGGFRAGRVDVKQIVLAR